MNDTCIFYGWLSSGQYWVLTWLIVVDNPSILYYVKSETVTFIFLLSRNIENYSYLNGNMWIASFYRSRKFHCSEVLYMWSNRSQSVIQVMNYLVWWSGGIYNCYYWKPRFSSSFKQVYPKLKMLGLSHSCAQCGIIHTAEN